MPIYAKDHATEFERPPTGPQNGVCCGVVDMGMIPGFKNKPTHKVALVFETEAVRKEGDYAGQRFVLTQEEALSLNEKSNLSKFLESWRGEAFTDDQRKQAWDVEQQIGQPCTLNLIKVKTKAGRDFVKIGGIMPKTEGAVTLRPENPPDFVPEWIRKKMLGENAQGDASGGGSDDDIPFN